MEIHLDKHVPYGSGLGGGSSDAAAVLRYLANATGIDLSDKRLVALAANVGSDVPFFLDDRPAIGTGRGEKLRPIQLEFPYQIVIAVPDVSISTADAYAGVVPRRPSVAGSQTGTGVIPDRAPGTVVVGCDPALWESSLVNDFETFVFGAFPQLERVKAILYGAGAFYASLSGSGSALYGLFSAAGTADAAVSVLGELHIHGWVGDKLRGRAF